MSATARGGNMTGMDDWWPGNATNITEMSYALIKQPVHMIAIYSLAYGIVFLLGLIGNSLVVSVVYRNPRMHNVTNYFIVNLAIADMLVCLLCLPITLLSNLFSGKSHSALCFLLCFCVGLYYVFCIFRLCVLYCIFCVFRLCFL